MKTGCDTKWVDPRYSTFPYADVTFVFFFRNLNSNLKKEEDRRHQAKLNVLKCLEKDKFAQITEILTLFEVRV